MSNIKNRIRKNSTLAEIIILLVGIILTWCSGQNQLLSGIGTSIVASAVIVFMTDVFIGTEENEALKQWGLETVYQTRGEMNRACDYYLPRAKTVCVIAFGLKSWRDSQQKQIEDLLGRGGIIRIITMKPESDNLRAREKDECTIENDISYRIKALLAWANEENRKGFKGRIEIRYHDRQPLDFLFLMDNRLFTGPYEYGKDSQQTISFEYNCHGAAYAYYRNYFEMLWNDKDFCTDALQDHV